MVNRNLKEKITLNNILIGFFIKIVLHTMNV